MTVLIALINGCSVQQTKPETVNWEHHQQRLLGLEQWHINGKMGYKQGSEGGSAWLDWQQNRDNFEVRLNGPFGAGTTSITGNARVTRLLQSDQQPIVASSARELTRYLFGWYWPVEDLRYWVRGVPSPLTPTHDQTRNEQQLLSTLEQAGWQLEFSNYANYPVNGQQWSLPGKIRGKLLEDNGDTSFTLIIKSWQIDAS
ncbi:MAG: lipoprotein insertase outer membrane protein LolB [Porticoccaceae bacterium]|nr:outer membrane lipoprotein LolB [Pseudomonadales bacterium]MCP5173385.1 outer membrane lipoprotein LolB [Pseudomonadales bacterium]